MTGARLYFWYALILACLVFVFSPAKAASIVNIETEPTSQVFVNGVPVFPVPTTMHAGIPVDVLSLPPGDLGYSTDRVRPTTEIAPAGGGAFRTVCTFARAAFDDPIVLLGLPGAAHSHTFMGNTGVNAFTTAASLANTGNSTCRGGTVNRSSYWFPTMVDQKTGKAILPRQFLAYYKAGNFSTKPDPTTFQPAVKFVPMPPGLRMVAGDPTATAPHPSEFSLRYKCVGGPKNQNALYGATIPQCDVGADMTMEVMFPQCWDGVNLDSPDHKSHMNFGVQVPNKGDPRGWFHLECPKSHPVVIPQIAFQIDYLTTEPDQKWRLSSDAYAPTLPPGLSGHGDWFNGWKVDIMKAWVDNCINANKDGHGHLLCDGRELY